MPSTSNSLIESCEGIKKVYITVENTGPACRPPWGAAEKNLHCKSAVNPHHVHVVTEEESECYKNYFAALIAHPFESYCKVLSEVDSVHHHGFNRCD